MSLCDPMKYRKPYGFDNAVELARAGFEYRRTLKPHRPRRKPLERPETGKELEFFQIPHQVALKLSQASAAAQALYYCLLELKYAIWDKNEYLIVSDTAAEKWGLGDRRRKNRALRELDAIGLVDATCETGQAPRVIFR